MDLIQFLVSVNKISVLAFVGTFGFLLYEFKLIQKDRQSKAKPNIPKFDAAKKIDLLYMQNATVVTDEPKAKTAISHKVLIGVLIVMLLLFGGISIIGGLITQKTTPADSQSQVIIQEVKSKGVKLYDTTFKELSSAEIAKLKQGDVVNIAVESIRDAKIDSARIRVNENEWKSDAITVKFNPTYYLFYKEYTIATNESILKIEAQLHSSSDGWLGD